ncbi:PIG-L deacetylase family protein [Bacillus dakarensis]|uniref:PIG-L deacetylase family protein n=1 Tax=Robertmurraya dakarensis TaxID=1926278 RepID=UPI0009812840|nr:PIG-L family deacetylase [Bacillus dakarensis]
MQSIQYENQRVLILAPHADDEVIGCGGVIQKYLEHQSTVRVAIATFVYGDYQKYYKEKSSYVNYSGSVRIKELETAYKTLGINDYVIFYDDKEGTNYHSKLDTIPRVNLVSKIEKEIDVFKPTVIYIPSITKHQDHTAMHQAALTAIRPYFWNGSVFVYETDGELTFSPNMFVTLNKEQAEKKAKALAAFRTQIGGSNHPTNPEFLLTKAIFRGQMVYSSYAEAFQIIRLHA